jgi:phosphatidylserine synthase
MAQKHLIKELSAADYVTVSAVAGIICAFWLLWQGQTALAISLAFISTFLDYLDGKVARKYGGSAYGQVLDSLYDVLGWVLFPALVINIQSHFAWWSVVTTTLFCLAAVLRLSRFTVEGYSATTKQTEQLMYVGLPVLFSKYALLVVFFADALVSTIILAVMIPLMLSSRLFKKPHPLLAQVELVYAAIFFWVYLRGH